MINDIARSQRTGCGTLTFSPLPIASSQFDLLYNNVLCEVSALSLPLRLSPNRERIVWRSLFGVQSLSAKNSFGQSCTWMLLFCWHDYCGLPQSCNVGAIVTYVSAAAHYNDLRKASLSSSSRYFISVLTCKDVAMSCVQNCIFGGRCRTIATLSFSKMPRWRLLRKLLVERNHIPN